MAPTCLSQVEEPCDLLARVPKGWPSDVARPARMLGVAVNYIPLAVYAIQLSQRGALDREMADVNPSAESRRAVVAQLALFIPFVVAAAAVTQAAARDR